MSMASAWSNAEAISKQEPFDSVAFTYDRTFTASAIGRAQRAQIMSAIARCFPPGSRVLELNCGTGEDALALARRGVEVSAYDASPAMIDVANRKLRSETPPANVSFGILRNERLAELRGSFDGALSNFAGMNCSRDWHGIAGDLASLIKPGGHVLLCVMGRACLWEILCFLLCGLPGKAFRRANRSLVSNIGSSSVDVFYPSVHEARRAFSAGFTLSGWRGVGVFVPPSYFEPFISRRDNLLRLLAALDLRFAHLPGVRFFGDHILLDFVRRPA